jgi:hypothetical protein
MRKEAEMKEFEAWKISERALIETERACIKDVLETERLKWDEERI